MPPSVCQEDHSAHIMLGKSQGDMHNPTKLESSILMHRAEVLTIPPLNTPEVVALSRFGSLAMVCVPFCHRKGPGNSGLEVTSAPYVWFCP